MRKFPVMIDVDTGVDDALALVGACASPLFDIIGVTTVGGNVDLKYTTPNTLNVLHLLGRGDIPVAAGAEHPLERELFKASAVHGICGLRGYTFKENHFEALVEEKAWDFTYGKIKASTEKVTILALGPLTNIATLILNYPDCGKYIEKIVFMGTSYHDGNPTAVSTFNVLVDPEALRIVLDSGIEFCAMPLDTTRKAYLTKEDVEEIGKISGPVAEFTYTLLGNYGSHTVSEEEMAIIQSDPNEEQQHPGKVRAEVENLSLHDPATVAFAAVPEIFTGTKYFMQVECKGELTTGFTLVDKKNYYGKTEEEKNVFFVESIEREKFAKWFIDSVHSYK